MGFIYNGGWPDITFQQETPRGPQFLLSLANRARRAQLFEPPGFFGEPWNTLEQTVNVRHNRPVPAWAIYGPPISRPLAPLRAQQMANYTTLGLLSQMGKDNAPRK